MKFECPNCKKSGQVDDSKVPESGVYATCPQCNNKFLIKQVASKEFDFEPVQENVKLKESPPPKIQDSEQQGINTTDRRQIYEAVIGKNINYYLPIFERFDRDGRTSASWNWPAFFCGGLWCLYRKMNFVGFLYIFVLMVLGVFEKADTQGVLAIPLFLTYSALSFGLGMYANTFYYNHINKKIRSLDLKDKNVLYQESFSKMFKPNKAVFYVLGVFIGLGVIGIIAAIAIPQFAKPQKKEYTSANIEALAADKHASLPAGYTLDPPTKFLPLTGDVDPVPPVQPVEKNESTSGWVETWSTDQIINHIKLDSIRKAGLDTVVYVEKQTLITSKYYVESINTIEADCNAKKYRILGKIMIPRDGSKNMNLGPLGDWMDTDTNSNGYNDIVGACAIARK